MDHHVISESDTLTLKSIQGMSNRDPHLIHNSAGSTAHGNFKLFPQHPASQANTSPRVNPSYYNPDQCCRLLSGPELTQQVDNTDNTSPKRANSPQAQDDKNVDVHDTSHDENNEDANKPVPQDTQERQDSKVGGVQDTPQSTPPTTWLVPLLMVPPMNSRETTLPKGIQENM